MNFFGHAALAASHFSQAGPRPSNVELASLCAGAMLPDFVGMLRLSRPRVSDPLVAHGVAFHHRTDEVFHELESFLRLSRQAFAWLSARSLARGPARAVAHIGIEILLDEVLAQDPQARSAYCDALRAPLTSLVTFPVEEDGLRLASLQRALLDRTSTVVSPAPELVAERIRRTLAGRPRLATDDAGQVLLGAWVTATRPLVAAEAPQVLATLLARLANFAGAE